MRTEKLKWILKCSVLLLIFLPSNHGLDTSPPLITKQPPAGEILFQVVQRRGEIAKPFIIECEAEGFPEPQYRWTKNGKEFNWQAFEPRVSVQQGRGTLVITSPSQTDIGQWQCFASNYLGTATSNSVFVRMAELNSFKDEDNPVVTSELAEEGQPFKLTCNLPDGYPKPRADWVLQNQAGTLKNINNSRMTVDPEGTLWFSSIELGDRTREFNYACSAYNVFQQEWKLGNRVFLQVTPKNSSSSIQSTSKVAPVLQYATKRKTVATKGGILELWCIVGGAPLPEVRWSKRASSYGPLQVQFDKFGKVLKIEDVQFSDAGSYECDASNGVGDPITYSITVEVQAAPYFKMEPDIINAAEGETVEFPCSADGVPSPRINWIFNGKPIEEADDNPRRGRVIINDRIVLRKILETDTGNYGCNASNSLGYVYKDVYLNVLALPPEIRTPPSDKITISSTQSTTLTCRVFGAPKPHIEWIHGDTKLTGRRFRPLSNGDLEIKDVQFSDAGRYTCFASNKFGNDSRSAELVVKAPTIITSGPQNYQVRAGHSATFHCGATGDPTLPLTIDWLNDGVRIDFDMHPRYIKLSDNSLTIDRTSEIDSGQYTCLAYTDYDNATASASLIVQELRCDATWNGIRWSSYTVGLVNQTCSRGIATWECKFNGKFEGSPNFSKCHSSWIVALDENIRQVPNINATESQAILTEFERVLTKEVYYGHEIKTLLDFGVDISKKLDDQLPLKNVKEITGRIFNVYGEIIKDESWSDLMDKQERAKYGTTILRNTEILVTELSNRVSATLLADTTNYAEEFLDSKQTFQVVAGILKDAQNQTLFYPINHNPVQAFIRLDIINKDNIVNKDNIKFTGIQMDGPKTNHIYANYHPDLKVSETELIVESRNLRTKRSIHRKPSKKGRGTHTFPKIGITLTFQNSESNTIYTDELNIKFPKQTDKAKGRSKRDTSEEETKLTYEYDYSSAECVYWDMDNSFWSPIGCKLVENNETCLVCQCNKFGLYSIVISYASVKNSWGFNLLKWFLFSVSTLALLITIIVFLLKPIVLYRSPDTRVLLNLLICLLIESILCVILMGDTLDLSAVGETVIGIFANYVYLCLVTWTVIESWKIFQSVTLCNKTADILENVFGYVFSGVLVLCIWATTALTNSDSEFDWMQNYYGWGFIGPLGIFTPVIWNYIYLSAKRMDCTINPIAKRRREAIKISIVGTIGFLLLLILTTITGFLIHTNSSDFQNVLEYVFVMLHAAQGIYFFVYHILMNKASGEFVKEKFGLEKNCHATTQEEETKLRPANYES